MTTADAVLTALFTDPSLVGTAADPDRSSLAAPYRALRRIQAHLGDQPLLADHVRLRTLLEHSAVADPRLFHAMFLHHCMAIGNVIDQGGSAEDVAALASGQWIGAALMTETGSGNSSSRIRTEAVYDPATREFVLRTPVPEAVKHPINVGLDGIARAGVVSARLIVDGTDRGTALFLVPLRDEHGPCPGVTIEPLPRTTLLSMDYATVRFDGVRVPYRRWLSDGASITADGGFHDPLDGPQARSRRSVSMARFAWGAVTAALGAVARSSVALALSRAHDRPTLDRLAGEIPAIDHLNQQRMLFGAAAAALAATVVARRATDRCWHIPAGGGRGTGPSGAVMRELSVTKVVISVLADTAVARCRSAYGAGGFFSAHRLIDYQALTTAFQSAGGDNRLILLDAAWAMATGPDYVPPDDRSTSDDEWVRLLRARERLLYAELTAGLPTDGAVPFDLWNDRTEVAQRLAETYGARMVVEAVHDEWHAATVPDSSRAVLDDLYELCCLDQVAAHSGWYLAHGLLTAEAVLALPERGNEVCRRLVRHTDVLSRLLEIPAELIGAAATRR
jgi:acyl-CoA oxidase